MRHAMDLYFPLGMPRMGLGDDALLVFDMVGHEITVVSTCLYRS